MDEMLLPNRSRMKALLYVLSSLLVKKANPLSVVTASEKWRFVASTDLWKTKYPIMSELTQSAIMMAFAVTVAVGESLRSNAKKKARRIGIIQS